MTDAQASYAYVQMLLKDGEIIEVFPTIHRVDIDNTPDNLTRIRFLDGSVLRLDFETLTVETA